MGEVNGLQEKHCAVDTLHMFWLGSRNVFSIGGFCVAKGLHLVCSDLGSFLVVERSEELAVVIL